MPRPTPTPEAALPAAAWTPGDYAECLPDVRWYARALNPARSGPGAGDVARVRSVVAERCPWTGKPVEMLTFDRWPGKAYPSRAFIRAAKPKLTIRGITRVAKRDPHAAGIGAAAIVTALCYGAAAVVQLFGGDQ